MSTFEILSSHFEKYITIKGHTGKRYTYRSENHRVVDHELHIEKCKKGSWLYIAIEGNSDVMNLDESQKLYVGCQTSDRMFRGDNLDGKNFHHREMRKGNGPQNNLLAYLETGGTVDIYIVSKNDLEILAAGDRELQYMRSILADPPKFPEHPAYWYEQIILNEEKESWSWNKKGTEEIEHINRYSQNILDLSQSG